MQSWKNSALLPIAIIVLILVASGIAIFTIRKGNDDQVNVTNNPTATATPTDEPTATGSVTPSGSTTPTATPSGTTTPTPTLAPSGTDPAITQTLNSAWKASGTSQTVGSQVYFISGKELKKGSSETDENASTVYTSANGDIKSFYVVSSSIVYVAEGRNSSTNESRLVKVSGSKTSLVYKYVAARAEVHSFLTNASSPTHFYLTFSPTSGSVQPVVAFEKDYKLDWSKTIPSTAKSDTARLRGVTSDNSMLILTITNSSGESRNVEYEL